MYSFDTRIRFSECDAKGNLKFTGLLNYLQDCSTFQSEDLGIGVNYLKRRGLVWVVNYWQIDILKYPSLCDRVTVGTFPYDFKGFIGFRNFFIKDKQGEYLAKANSIWTMLDIETGRPQKPSEEDIAPYGLDEKLEMEYLPRKIKIPDNIVTVDSIEIKQHHLDTNNHVNNGQYIQMAAECLAAYENHPVQIKGIRAEYKKQVYLSEILVPAIGKTENGAYVISFNNKSDETVCIVELY